MSGPAPRAIDAVISAGGLPGPGSPLYQLTRGRPKALLEVAGKPMVQWVLDALDAAPAVRRVVIAGVEPGTHGLESRKLAGAVADHGGPLENSRAGLVRLDEDHRCSPLLLLVSSDIPCITPRAVSWLVTAAQAGELDVWFTAVTREHMDRRYPTARRTYFRFRDATLTAGDLHVVRTAALRSWSPTSHPFHAARKSPLRLAWIVGPTALIRFVLRRVTVAEAARIASASVGFSCGIVTCPYAEVGMDVDRPEHVLVAEGELAARRARS